MEHNASELHTLRLMATTGQFRTVSTHQVATTAEAQAIVEKYAQENGFKGVKLVDDGDYTSLRFTATTPGGRAGRNVAFLDYAGTVEVGS